MEENKGANSAAGKAHDQETQTNFDVNGTSESSRETVHAGIPNNLEREHQHYRPPLPSWGGRYSYPPPQSYPDGYYQYEGGYPPPPQPVPYYQGRYPHWHHHAGAAPYPSPHAPPMGPGHPYAREYPPSGYFPQNVSESPKIARPKAEWPRGYQPFPKPTVPSDYLATIHAPHRNAPSEYTGPPSTATSLRSTVIDLPSPRGSARLARKRARSNTPASSVESIDLNLLIRNSPDSLIGYLGGGRLSSVGSFGHLSPTGFCVSPACRQTPTLTGRPPPFITPPPIPPLQSPTIAQTKDLFPSSTTTDPPKESENDRMSCGESPPPPAPSHRDTDVLLKKEDLNEPCKLDSTTSPLAPENEKALSDHGAEEGPGEGEGIDLTCHWKDCTQVFENQESMVKHVNGDHIKKEKRDFTCYWKDCTREQRPFKAQYMLVVHMRRHTGEKPHKCDREGCSKAYSRLENLKTHLRSHTGERPYVCEVEGCTKAFSNASDRAKHQNRTHSSVKPYVCKVEGCPKRYTDPSSLRKHTKTVHGEQGIKRLKEEGSRDKQPQHPPKKSTGPAQGQSTQPSGHTANANTFVNSPASDVKSPGSAGVSSGISYSSIVTNSCNGDIVSSTCNIPSPPSDNHESDVGSPAAVNQNVMSMHSPRSPPYVNHLPNILEGGMETAGDVGVVSTVQTVASHPKSVSLPKIQESPQVKQDVRKWVDDVHRRMSQTSTRRSSEASHLSIDTTGDVSRRSSESGWASNNESRRSSEASPFPNGVTQIAVKNPFDTIPHPPIAPGPSSGSTTRKFVQTNGDIEDCLRRTSETSTTSTNSALFNRPSRNSSGYGSQSNLAVIQSSGFGQRPALARELPYYRLHHSHESTFRRMSDTVICEADSSVMASQHNKEEFRRRSEPTRNINWTAHRQDLSNQLSPRGPPIETSETELISGEFDPSELDAYLPQQDVTPMLSPSGRQTQPLRHYPYLPADGYPPQDFPRESQTIHHRPQPQPNVYYQTRYGGPSDMPPPMQRPRNGYIRQQPQQPRLQSLPQGQIVMQYQERYPPSQVMYQPPPPERLMVPAYEDAMVNGIGALSTDNVGMSDDYELGNLVVNNMNTLLNSLAEEDKYLEMRQNARSVNGSAMSSAF